MAEGVVFPFPSLPLNEGAHLWTTRGRPYKFATVATGLRLRLPGLFQSAGLSARPAHAAGGTLAQGVPTASLLPNQKKMLSEINAGYGRKGESYHGDISLTVKIVGRSKGKICHPHRHILMEM